VKRALALAIVAPAALLLTACGGGSGGQSAEYQKGYAYAQQHAASAHQGVDDFSGNSGWAWCVTYMDPYSNTGSEATQWTNGCLASVKAQGFSTKPT
jgi:hypothetical protein